MTPKFTDISRNRTRIRQADQTQPALQDKLLAGAVITMLKKLLTGDLKYFMKQTLQTKVGWLSVWRRYMTTIGKH
jgi:hypothetical protein